MRRRDLPWPTRRCNPVRIRAFPGYRRRVPATCVHLLGRRQTPDHLTFLVELTAGVETEIDGDPGGGVVVGMDVCGEVEDSPVRQPTLHGGCCLPGIPLALPFGADHPCQLGVFPSHCRLDVADGNTFRADDPVVPDLTPPRASSHLEAVAFFELMEGGWLPAGEDVEIGIGEDAHHLGGVIGFERGECETGGADRSDGIDGATLADDLAPGTKPFRADIAELRAEMVAEIGSLRQTAWNWMLTLLVTAVGAMAGIAFVPDPRSIDRASPLRRDHPGVETGEVETAREAGMLDLETPILHYQQTGVDGLPGRLVVTQAQL